MNKYDLEHVTTGHSVMTSGDWQEVYRRAGDLYYSAEHIEMIFRRQRVRYQAGAYLKSYPAILFRLPAGKRASAAGRLISTQLRRERRAPTAIPR